MTKFVEEYQITDRNGNPVGPKQRFEAETIEELKDKLKAAHQNAAAGFYEERKRRKLGDLIEPDPSEPVYAFEEKELTADELVQIDELMKDVTTRPQAMKLLIEAQLGAPIEKVRENLREIEYTRRSKQNEVQVDLFLVAHPDYIPSDSNQGNIEKYLLKHELAVTKKNLDLAYDDLKADGLLTLQAPKPVETVPATAAASAEAVATVSASSVSAAIVAETVPAVPAPVVPAYRQRRAITPAEMARMTADEYKVWLDSGDDEPVAPLSQPAIPAPMTAAAPISAQPSEVRPRVSSSGLSSRDSSVSPESVSAPKTKGITAQEVNAMTADEYAKRLRDPEFRAAVDELFKKSA